MEIVVSRTALRRYKLQASRKYAAEYVEVLIGSHCGGRFEIRDIWKIPIQLQRVSASTKTTTGRP
ncbi:MAG TPA: hypothetical protein VKB79_00445 [Bryobacteraceae bacterium]|nr:hypothetical protein [Bryobacteraceae bacterium]